MRRSRLLESTALALLLSGEARGLDTARSPEVLKAQDELLLRIAAWRDRVGITMAPIPAQGFPWQNSGRDFSNFPNFPNFNNFNNFPNFPNFPNFSNMRR